MVCFLHFLKRLVIVFALLLVLFSGIQRGLEIEQPPSSSRTEAGSDTPATKPVTIADVKAAKVPTPIRSKVSFPAFSYKQAFPEATGAPEITITKFGEAPALAKRTALPKTDPQWLPPVAERLPRNPAVVQGCDGVGVYGGQWRQCTSSAWHVGRKIGYESFVRFDPSGRLQPGVAYKWEVSDDFRVFTFYLRKGHKWSDGHPFTSHDIVWVCNVNIGSAHWSSPPNWMQPTDGTILLYVEDVLDWPAFLKRLQAEGTEAAASPGKQIWSLAPEKWRALVVKASAKTMPDKGERRAIVTGLNQLFQKQALFAADAYAALDRKSELEALRAKGVSRLTAKELKRLNLLAWREELWDRATGAAAREVFSELDATEVIRLNLLCFRAAYAGLVARAEKTRVKIEPVPDENGDDTHILRFTFRKPNSFFLEKTATFMFYRGLFNIPPHIFKKYHVLGSTRLETVDILRYNDFATKLVTDAKAPDASPSKRLWSLLNDKARAAFEAVATTGTATAAQKQSLVDSINQALAKPTYYQAELWPKLGWSVEKAELAKKSYSKRTEAERLRWDELRILLDLLKRVQQDGMSSLSPAGVYRLNLALFRAAYDEGIVGKSREASLNHEAQNGKPAFDWWVSKLRALGRYYQENGLHYPVITAWRTITPPDKRLIRSVRNDYYYKVDVAGNQLPYLDELVIEREADTNVRLFKLRSGSVDFQTRNIEFKDFTVLKQSEAKGKYELRLWANDYCGELTFYFLQAHKNPLYRKLQDDPRFRYALSSALNREEMIDVVWKGMGKPAQWSVPEGSPYYNPRHSHAYVKYAPALANKLLDEIGLDKRAADGTRLFWDGKTPVVLDVNAVPERPIPAVQMVCNYWQAVGINAQMKIREGPKINRMISLGTLDVGVHKEGGNYFGPVLAGGFAPTHPAECPQWGKWVNWLWSNGRSGWEPPERMKKTALMWDDVVYASSEAEKMAAWNRLSDRIAKELPIIGVMTSPGQPVYVKNGFKNVPRLALSGWIAHQPGNCCPEAFFWEKGKRPE